MTRLPPALRPGDTIGLFSPAGPIRSLREVEAGISVLQRHGFFTKHMRMPEHAGYLAGSDSERLDEIHRLFADDDVKALLAVRGGFGCLRLLEGVNIDFIRRHPKPVIGFSDVTCLLNMLALNAGFITFHGPVLTTLAKSDTLSLESFFRVITGNFSPCYDIREIEIVRTGTGTGVLRGGNLTTLVHLIGTPYEIPWQNSILLLEDIGEAPYRLDRMLTQLASAGKLQDIAGLIIGSFNLEQDDPIMTRRMEEDLWTRTLELTRDCSFPIWGNFPAGHLQRNHTLPIGMHAVMDSSTARLEFIR